VVALVAAVLVLMVTLVAVAVAATVQEAVGKVTGVVISSLGGLVWAVWSGRDRNLHRKPHCNISTSNSHFV
jgi:positive regulator of sigma E activity